MKKQKGRAAKRLTPTPPPPPPPPPPLPNTQPSTLPGHLLIGQLFFICMFNYLTLWLVHLGQLGQGKTIRAFAGAYDASKGVNFFLTRTLAKVNNCMYKFHARSRTLFDLPCAIRIVNYLKEAKSKQGLLWGVTKPRISTLHRVD